MRKILFSIFLFLYFTPPVCPKDIELVLYRNSLQKLINKIFPIILSEGQVYRVYLNNPALSIQPRYIQIDSVVNISSAFGDKTFPSRCKLVPIYNSRDIELKVIEGSVDLGVINLGTIDLSRYISNIKIPLEINTINIKDRIVRSRCRNVAFQLLRDRIIVSGDLIVE